MSQLNSTRYPFLTNSKEACCANYSCEDVSISTPAPTDMTVDNDAPNQTPSPSPGPSSASPTSGSPIIVSRDPLLMDNREQSNE